MRISRAFPISSACLLDCLPEASRWIVEKLGADDQVIRAGAAIERIVACDAGHRHGRVRPCHVITGEAVVGGAAEDPVTAALDHDLVVATKAADDIVLHGAV